MQTYRRTSGKLFQEAVPRWRCQPSSTRAMSWYAERYSQRVLDISWTPGRSDVTRNAEIRAPSAFIRLSVPANPYRATAADRQWRRANRAGAGTQATFIVTFNVCSSPIFSSIVSPSPRYETLTHLESFHGFSLSRLRSETISRRFPLLARLTRISVLAIHT